MSPFNCNVCGRSFVSKSSLKQHRRDAPGHIGNNRTKHHGRNGGHDHNPPHADIEGYWIDRNRFRGTKSFGCFECGDCQKKWSSAHAFRKYKQGCQDCETKSYPCCLWFNTGDSNGRDSYEDEDENKPHDSARCEACRHGVCKFG